MNRKPIIAIDIDDTTILNGYPDMSQARLVSGAKQYIDKIREMVDCELIGWTCRHSEKDVTEAIEFLKNHGITFDYFNENSPTLIQSFGDCRKIFCDVLVDDCALAPTMWDWSNSPVNWKKAFKAVRRRLIVKGFPLKSLCLDGYDPSALDALKGHMKTFSRDLVNIPKEAFRIFPEDLVQSGSVSEEFSDFYKDVGAMVQDGVVTDEDYEIVEKRHLLRMLLLYNGIPVTQTTMKYLPTEIFLQELPNKETPPFTAKTMYVNDIR